MTEYPGSKGISLEEMAELQRLAAGTRVLELGSWRGTSARAMAKVAAEVWTVDHHRGDKHTGPAATLIDFLQATQAEREAGRIIPIVGDISQVLHGLDLSRFGLIFHDADHTAEGVARDLGLIALHGASGAWLAVHDWGLFGVTPGARMVLPPPLRIVGRLAIFLLP